MVEVLRFLTIYEYWIYLGLGLLAIVYARRLISGIKTWQESIFGLERDIARRQISQAISVLVIILLVVVGIFFLVTVVSTKIPGVRELPTPTLDLMATPDATLPAETQSAGEGAATPVPAVTQSATGCIPGQIEITSPAPGEKVQGEVELIGTVNVTDFGFYKYEVGQSGAEEWRTIAAANELVLDGLLGKWDTTQFVPGDYLLRIVVTDNKGNTHEPPCVIPVQVLAP
jgi:hypothetical protein